MARSIVSVFLCLVVLFSISLPTSQAQSGVVVGVEPGMYDTVVAGVQGWNAAGVGFVVEASGCGTGDVTFCYSSDPYSFGGGNDWVAWYVVGGNVIRVSTVTSYPFTPSVACHELGHWLGLHYHRSDYASCMSDPASWGPPSPDSIDLENLGLSWITSDSEDSLITNLPKTGSGP